VHNIASLAADPEASHILYASAPLQQMGNAVCPQVAAALGRCLATAALHEAPPGQMLVPVPDAEYDTVRLRFSSFFLLFPLLRKKLYTWNALRTLVVRCERSSRDAWGLSPRPSAWVFFA
jgi:hypothetical protein